MRVHLLKSMRIRSNEPLPESYDDSQILPSTKPVRFVWEKTVKKCAHNAAMKTRVLKDLIARRKHYKLVPDKDFEKKALDAVFEQAFLTLRQKFKLQKDDSSAIQYKRREDQKYLKARRKDRKKTVSHNNSLYLQRFPLLISLRVRTETSQTNRTTQKARHVRTLHIRPSSPP